MSERTALSTPHIPSLGAKQSLQQNNLRDTDLDQVSEGHGADHAATTTTTNESPTGEASIHHDPIESDARPISSKERRPVRAQVNPILSKARLNSSYKLCPMLPVPVPTTSVPWNTGLTPELIVW